MRVGSIPNSHDTRCLGKKWAYMNHTGNDHIGRSWSRHMAWSIPKNPQTRFGDPETTRRVARDRRCFEEVWQRKWLAHIMSLGPKAGPELSHRSILSRGTRGSPKWNSILHRKKTGHQQTGWFQLWQMGLSVKFCGHENPGKVIKSRESTTLVSQNGSFPTNPEGPSTF